MYNCKKIDRQYRTVKSLLLGTIDSILNVSWVALIYWTAQCAHLIFIQQLLCMLHKCIYWDVRIDVSTVWLHFLFLLLRCSTCTLVFGCCELSHVIFLKLRKKELLAKWSKLSKNSCHFVNLLIFASSNFLISLKKITWLNSQQPKTRVHVEHLLSSL